MRGPRVVDSGGDQRVESGIARQSKPVSRRASIEGVVRYFSSAVRVNLTPLSTVLSRNPLSLHRPRFTFTFHARLPPPRRCVRSYRNTTKTGRIGSTAPSFSTSPPFFFFIFFGAVRNLGEPVEGATVGVRRVCPVRMVVCEW